MNVTDAQKLFAMISINPELPKSATKRRRNQEEIVIDISDINDPGQKLQTVTAQTFQNYKSALKW